MMRFPVLMWFIAVSAAAQTVTFTEHIAPIIYNNCTKCHRTGQVAPFTLASYADVKQRALTIASVTRSGFMPPWKAEPTWAAFRDERRLTSEQIALIQQWVATGMPQGDPAKEPALPNFPDGWQLGAPDLVLEMPKAYSVAADGPDIYQNFVVQTGLTEEKYIRAVEIRSTARAALHHVLFFTDTTGGARKKEAAEMAATGQPGFSGFGSVLTLYLSDIGNPLTLAAALAGGMGGWVPGATPEFLPEGLAYVLPKGADLILQTHFHPDGKVESEKTVVALYFTTRPLREITQVQAPGYFGVLANIDIPAGKSDYKVRGSYTLPVDVEAFSVSAHAHYLARGARMTATLPSGEVRVLFWIKDWDFNWQDTYFFNDLQTLPKGTRIDGELTYDNSANNFRNPFSPPRRVKWGENSTAEMGSLILNVVPKQATDTSTLRASILKYTLALAAEVGNKPFFISDGVVDGASALAAPVVPGKVTVLYGERLGTGSLTPGFIDNGKLGTNVNGTEVLFDGKPAPILYTSEGQVAVMAPYALDGKAGTQVVVKNGAAVSDPIALPVAAVGPSIFSMDTSGVGQGVILNSDLSVNSSSKPADKGSMIVIYATGEGQTQPDGIDGQLANGPACAKPVGSVTVKIGGVSVAPDYAGAAPTLVGGVMQINVRVPSNVPSGDVPVEVQVGAAKSQAGITVAVR
ncbi:MAG: hypothetical protein JWN34_1037 [Bryobacterales bacterium]|nr:hypothetical protein [Bryobacterales bacterium]